MRFAHPSVVYAKKQLLQSQLEIISTLQRVKKYHAIREEELSLKLELKKKFDELKTEVAVFEKILPKQQRKEEDSFELPVEKQIKRSELEDEIDNIKAKLAQLQ